MLSLIDNDFGPEIRISLFGSLQYTTNCANGSDCLKMIVKTDVVTETDYYFIIGNESQSFHFKIPTDPSHSELNWTLYFSTNRSESFPFELSIDRFSLNIQTGTILAGVILISLNILIVTEVDKTDFQISIHFSYKFF